MSKKCNSCGTIHGEKTQICWKCGSMSFSPASVEDLKKKAAPVSQPIPIPGQAHEPTGTTPAEPKEETKEEKKKREKEEKKKNK